MHPATGQREPTAAGLSTKRAAKRLFLCKLLIYPRDGLEEFVTVVLHVGHFLQDCGESLDLEGEFFGLGFLGIVFGKEGACVT